MHDIAIAFLTLLLQVLGANQSPQSVLQNWDVSRAWEPRGQYFVLEASNQSLIAECSRHPEKYILFPQVIHGVHEISIDGIPLKRFGDASFNRSSPFYQQTYIECTDLSKAATLQWKVTSYSRFFSRISSSPKMVTSVSAPVFFNVGANVIAGGSLVVLAIFSLLIYYGRVSHQLTYSVALGSLTLSFYFFNAINSYVGLDLSMIASHKFADIALWIGGILFLNAFRLDGLLNRKVFYLYTISALLGIGIILAGNSGDEVQFGTMIPMVPCVVACLNIILHIRRLLFSKTLVQGYFLKLVSISLFTIFGVNDIFHVMGVIDGYVLLSIGIVFGVLGLSVAVNQEIENTYSERDSLLKNLENKVEEKTEDLQRTLESLKGAQAELVQSAKLACLGTLSAGIAHEINNSINYVSGAVIPLERRVMASASDSDKVIFTKLFSAIKEGTSLTVEIVRSLRTFTGLNQAALKEMPLQDVFSSVLTILKSKLSGIKVESEVEENLIFYGNIVGLNQMLMNLLTNAIDAMPAANAVLKLSARSEENQVIIEVTDNDSGMPAEIQKKIFDPFYTTKEVGKGTGLGLHIVQKEVERHEGSISVSSIVGQGTTFVIKLPRRIATSEEAA